MDRRSLIFLLCFTLSAMGIQWYFQQQRQQEIQAWKQKHPHSELVDSNYQPKCADCAKLKDPQDEFQFHYGFKVSNNLILIKNTAALEETLKNSGNTIEDSFGNFYNLVSKSKDNQFLILKTDSNVAALLNTADAANITQAGFYNEASRDVSYGALVDFSSNEGWVFNVLENNSKIIYGFYQNNTLVALKDLFDAKSIKVLTAAELTHLFVLENSYLQLAIDLNKGFLSEINIPFEETTSAASIVKETEIDRQFIEQNPNLAKFPSDSYFQNQITATPINPTSKGYYPLLRRSFNQLDNEINAFGLCDEKGNSLKIDFKPISTSNSKLILEGFYQGAKIRQIFTLSDSKNSAPYVFEYELQSTQPLNNIWVKSGVTEVEWISGASTPVVKYRYKKNQTSEVFQADLPTKNTSVWTIQPDWICNSNGFLGTILDPHQKNVSEFRIEPISGELSTSRLTKIDEKWKRYNPSSMPGYRTLIKLPASQEPFKMRVYAGPFAKSALVGADNYYKNDFDGYSPEYQSCQSFHGWFSFISEPFAKVMFFCMNIFHKLTNSWGFSIFLLTLLLRVLLYPLNSWSAKSMQTLQIVAPLQKAIEEKYKGDPAKAQMEIIMLYKKYKVNPLSGCLPLLIQMPFLIGMFDLLKSSFELRGANFIPGWIEDLAAPDVLFKWGYPLPIIGNELHILPIILALTMWLQQKVMSPQTNPEQLSEAQKQQKSISNFLPFFLAFMFYSMPAGLGLYWFFSTILGVAQQYWTQKNMKGPTKKTDVVELN